MDLKEVIPFREMRDVGQRMQKDHMSMLGLGDCTPKSGPDLHPCMTLFNDNFVNTGAVRTAGWISSRLVLSRVSAAKGLQGKGAGIVWQQSMQSGPKCLFVCLSEKQVFTVSLSFLLR